MPVSSTSRRSNFNLRVSEETRALIDEAAAALGKSRTEFVIESARKSATDALLDRRLFLLNEARHAQFLAALDAPPPPNAALKKLMGRKPLWAR